MLVFCCRETRTQSRARGASETWANRLNIARGDIANDFATKAITRFTNDPIGIGREGDREGHCYQRLPRETNTRGPSPNGANGETALHEWAALSIECRGEHQCNHKRVNWSLHPLRAYGSPQGYRCRTPGAWGPGVHVNPGSCL